MATNVFDLFAKLSIDSSEFEMGLTKAKNSASGFGNTLSGAMKIGIKAIGAATTAVVGFATASVSVGADFDKSMSQVAATMGKSVDEIQELRDFAQEMGRTTAFSATQAADALNYMALAGYKVEESMEMLPNVLNLAAAGSMDLARASDMVTDASTAFGLSIEENGPRITQMVDEMAKAASTGNTSVEQLGEAFLTVGGLAQELNGGMVTLKDGTEQSVDGIQELEIALTAMANAGIKGSEAGTHMRNMLLKLSSPTADGTKQLEKLGVKVFDTAGNMRSLRNIMGDLSDALGDLTQEQKIQAISDLFNTRDLASAEALLNAVGEDWDEIGEAILDAEGAASKMAETQLDNLAGDVTLFKSALEGAKIAISDKLTPSLREFVKFGTDGISRLTEAFKEGGLEGAMESLGTIFSTGFSKLFENAPNAVNAGVALLKAIAKGITDNINVILFAAGDIMEALFDGMLDASSSERNVIIDILTSIFNSFEESYADIIDKGYQIVANIIKGITNSMPDLFDAVITLVSNAAERLTNPESIKKVLDAGLNFVKTFAQGVIKGIPVLVREIPVIINNVLTSIKEGFPMIIATLVELVTMIVEELPNIITAIADALPEILTMLVDTLITLLPVIIDGMIQLVVAITEHLPEIIQALIDAIPQIIQAYIDAWMTAIPAIVQGIIQLVSGIVPHIPEIIAVLIMSIPQIIEAIIEGFRPLIENMVNLFGEIGTAISEWWAQKKQDIANGWSTFIENVKEWFAQLPYNLGYALADMLIKLGEWYTEAKNWVDTNVSKFIESVVNWFATLPNKIWNWLKETLTRIGNWINDTDAKVKETLPAVIDGIVNFFAELPGKAWDWGVDMIQSFIDGIGHMAQQAWDAIESFAQGIADRLGFSEPEIGPLSNFHTYAPDMMKLFAEGVTDNAYIVGDAIEKSFDFADDIVSSDISDKTYQSNSASDLNKIVILLQEIIDHGLDIGLEGEAADIFHVIETENRRNTKAKGYNTLAMMGG